MEFILSVQRRTLFPYKKHLISKALKVSAAFLQGGKLLVKIVRCFVVFVLNLCSSMRR